MLLSLAWQCTTPSDVATTGMILLRSSPPPPLDQCVATQFNPRNLHRQMVLRATIASYSVAVSLLPRGQPPWLTRCTLRVSIAWRETWMA